MRFASLGSGSKGNATLVQAGATLVMIDCGFSARETCRRLQRLAVAPEQLDAILVTHEHTDHSAGVARLSRRFKIPVYLTHGTRDSGRCDDSFQLCPVHCERDFTIGELSIRAITVPHDAAEPCQYLFRWRQRRLGVLTDLGSVTPHVVDSYSGCHGLMLEFNHHPPLLHAGTYPPALKRRVGGDWGHLSNRQASELLARLDSSVLRHLVVAHISENNNTRAFAEEALNTVSDAFEQVTWACQSKGFDWLQL